MNILDFKLNLSKEDSYRVLSKVLDSAMKRDLRVKLNELGMENRTRLMELWSWKMTNYRLMIPEREARDAERKIFMDKLLQKMSVEDWIIWVSDDRIWTIEYILREATAKNIVVKLLMNPGDPTQVEEAPEPGETFN